ncbi:Peptidoglycan/xylan/chitin deacetylase, PgdA/CDA1 family [Kaistia soli DSM 19436]|uniref:Chitooligosaccharide deacetylase n=1 Tax=Kaistia soli DSM 19436 TaxID=1122133 RepID=A0A1M5GAB8_9HYPH|nr:allantoinase PuuE [Kaistia soli]SHG00634.1 Peptidoglycan/xylan/chitin deacetylase, PgdA/CDA1 family [Kaistia soli DSM 19436]
MTDNDLPPRDFIGYGPTPPHPRWPGGARLALNIVLNVEEGSERSFPDGDEMTEDGLTEGGVGGFKGRDLAAESMFEYGARAGFWRILRTLAERGVTATTFACAVAIERNPAIAAAIRSAGFDVCCHGYRWEPVQLLGEERERELVAKAVASLTETLGSPPSGWYCRYAPSVFTRRIIAEHGGFLYDSDSYADDLPYYVQVAGQPHLVVPYTLTNNDTKFVRGGISTGRQFADYLIEAFDVLYREGAETPKMMSVGLHSRIIGHAARISGLERFLDHVARHDDVWICRREDIARHWLTEHKAA